MTREQGSSPAPLYGLVCSGGGVMGAYQVGVLSYIHDRFCRGEHSPFQVFTGISCGSINAGYLATVSHRARQGVQDLERLWRAFHVAQYHRGLGGLLRRSLAHFLVARRRTAPRFWSLLDPAPMRELFDREIKRPWLDEALRLGTTLGVGLAAKEATENLSTWFVEGPLAVEWRRRHAACRLARLGPEHVAASCSVPLYFPPVEVDGRLYFDGAIHLERPFAAAISMGATRILGISSAASPGDRRADRPRRAGSSIENLLRSMLSAYNHDFMTSEVEQIGVLNRFAEVLPDDPRAAAATDAPFNAVFDARHLPHRYVPIEVVMISPSSSLRALADSFRNRHPGVGGRAVPVGLLFHRELIGELIRLGTADARAAHHRLERLFAPGRSELGRAEPALRFAELA